MRKVWLEVRHLSETDVAALARSFAEPPARHTQLLLALQAAEDLAEGNGRLGELHANQDLAAHNLYEAAFGISTNADLWYSAEEVGPPFDGALYAVGCAVAAVILEELLAPEMRDLLWAPWSEVVASE